MRARLCSRETHKTHFHPGAHTHLHRVISTCIRVRSPCRRLSPRRPGGWRWSPALPRALHVRLSGRHAPRACAPVGFNAERCAPPSPPPPPPHSCRGPGMAWLGLHFSSTSYQGTTSAYSEHCILWCRVGRPRGATPAPCTAQRRVMCGIMCLVQRQQGCAMNASNQSADWLQLEGACACTQGAALVRLQSAFKKSTGVFSCGLGWMSTRQRYVVYGSANLRPRPSVFLHLDGSTCAFAYKYACAHACALA